MKIQKVTVEYNWQVKQAIVTLRQTDNNVAATVLSRPELVQLKDAITQQLSKPTAKRFNIFKPQTWHFHKRQKEKVTISSDLYQQFQHLVIQNNQLKAANKVMKNALLRLKRH